MNRLLLLALPAALLAGCAKPATEDSPEATPPAAAATNTPGDTAPAPGLASELGRYHWRLQQATDTAGKRIDALFVRADKPLQVDFRDGRISVANSCNGIGGNYTLTGDTLTTGPLASTEMACAEPGLMALDREAGQRLEGALKASLEPDADTPVLRLVTTGGDTLVFSGEPTADTRHGGPGEQVFLEVAAQTKPCSHPLIPDHQCLQVRELRYDDNGLKVGTPGAFENFYDAIEGYTHQPGVRNVLRVMRYTVENPPADASSKAYVLDMVVESENAAPAP